MINDLQKRILILDDDPDTVSLLKLRFEAKGFKVFSSANGIEGLAKLRKTPPHLIILDALMPKLNGIEVFKTIKQDNSFALTPILVLTGKPSFRQQFVEMGCDYFATKPFNALEIIKISEQLMRQKVLVVGDYNDFREHIRSEFSETNYELSFVDTVEQMQAAVAQKRFHLIILRLAQVKNSPTEFFQICREESLNPQIKTFVYCDAYVPGTENGDELTIAKLEFEWVKAGHVLFYDARIHGRSIVEFLAPDR